MRKTFPLLFLLIACVVFYFTSNFCKKKTDGFTVAFIHSDLSYNPAWEIAPLSQEAQNKLEKVFSQKFRYLNCGGQSFVFISESNDYVIKFFKQRIFRTPYSLLLKLPLPSVAEHFRVRKLAKSLHKLNRDFTSYKIAYEELQEETGLLYIHLNKTRQLNRSLTIIDKIGIEHQIDLDKIEFVVQKRAELLFPSLDALMAKGDIEGAKQTLHAILEAIVNRCKKGIFDEDPRIHSNLGLLGSKAIFIDIGRFVHDPQRALPQIYRNDAKVITHKRLRHWLEQNHPQLVNDLDEELEKIL